MKLRWYTFSPVHTSYLIISLLYFHIDWSLYYLRSNCHVCDLDYMLNANLTWPLSNSRKPGNIEGHRGLVSYHPGTVWCGRKVSPFFLTATATYFWLVDDEISNWTVRSNTWTASPEQNPITGVMKFRFQPVKYYMKNRQPVMKFQTNPSKSPPTPRQYMPSEIFSSHTRYFPLEWCPDRCDTFEGFFQFRARVPLIPIELSCKIVLDRSQNASRKFIIRRHSLLRYCRFTRWSRSLNTGGFCGCLAECRSPWDWLECIHLL